MWIILLIATSVASIVNLYKAIKKKDYRLWMALALALTSIVLCVEYSIVAEWAMKADFSAIEDVVPTTSKGLWFFTIGSCIINMLPLLRDKILD